MLRKLKTPGRRSAPMNTKKRLAQHRIPDLTDPKVRADIRRQARLLGHHPENDAIDSWIEAVYDWSEWR
jgi:hypothetical protein